MENLSENIMSNLVEGTYKPSLYLFIFFGQQQSEQLEVHPSNGSQHQLSDLFINIETIKLLFLIPNF